MVWPIAAIAPKSIEAIERNINIICHWSIKFKKGTYKNLINTVRAATFGRGVWDSPLNSSSTYASSEIVNNLNIYPNPASNQLYVKLKSSDLVHFEIRSISGKIIKEGTLASCNYIDISRVNSGTYIIKIRVGNSSYRQKISITQNSR